jgi:hypothetical protein
VDDEVTFCSLLAPRCDHFEKPTYDGWDGELLLLTIVEELRARSSANFFYRPFRTSSEAAIVVSSARSSSSVTFVRSEAYLQDIVADDDTGLPAENVFGAHDCDSKIDLES